ncbi:MAG TPA: hypothetical protein DEB09_03810 [Candidatus Magasanikbacteria bacterium]|nr:hypothetical protein [Candidatus Magasanikbacteria bacterium]
MSIKHLIKKILPSFIFNIRHLFYAWYGSVRYNHPSEDLLVIGITGTTGKSSVIHFLRQVLEYAGFKVGSLSTVDFCINGKCELNDKKMTMVGKMFIQEKLRAMVDAGCNVAIVETTSEGRVQNRHRFINYDMMLLNNLYPEHIESHGSFENYKQAKLDLFAYTAKCKEKKSGKIAIVNGENKYADEFLQFNFDQKIKFSLADKNITSYKEGIHFGMHGYNFSAPLYGKHNAENLIAVVEIGRALDIDWQVLQEAIAQIKSPPGRIEFITEAKEKGFQVIVDYAFEPVALQKLYDVVDMLEIKGRIIHVCGSTGGGRDKARREPIGKLVGEKSDIFIITDEDPYDEDPLEIMEAVKKGALSASKEEGKNLFMILNREEAIKKALSLAENEDLVLITGKGSEQKMCVAGGKMIDWDDREIVHRYLDIK